MGLSHRAANSRRCFVALPACGSPDDYFERAAAQCCVLRATEHPPPAERRDMPPLPAPPARSCRIDSGIVTTIRDTVSCSWIFYSNSSASTAGEGAAPPPSEPDPALDSMHMMLEPHLRPISPDLNNEESKRIFEEHKQLAQEYLKIQTEFAYLSNHKAELEAKMDDDELRQKREIIQLEKEKESLIKLYCSLNKQLARVENDSWIHAEEMPHQ